MATVELTAVLERVTKVEVTDSDNNIKYDIFTPNLATIYILVFSN